MASHKWALLALTCLFFSVQGVVWPSECGIDNISKDNTRIVGGYFAEQAQFPWQAHLLWQDDFFCGGTLIHPNWILTAVHCVYGYEEPASDYTVRLGELNSDVDEGTEQTFDVIQVFTHPQYGPLRLDYDMALLHLASPVTFNEYISPACFVSETEMFNPGMTCITSGWGTINPEGTISGPDLKYEFMQLWDNVECEGPSTDYDGQVTDRMICAGFYLSGSEDPQKCAVLGYGDSGGPLVCPSALNGGNWTVIGATSWEAFCDPQKYTPGVFARVQAMRDWIIETIDANPDL